MTKTTLDEIAELKTELGSQVLVLGHHYQQDDVIRFADETGDSLQLAKIAKNSQADYIVFCGVHFMAETADMLTANHQQVILPDLKAGCSMADMAQLRHVERAWEEIQKAMAPQKSTIVPITYINCAASLKAFVGKNGGAICTSSNAKNVIEWALGRGEKLFFFPDQHLGRNTCFELGIDPQEMVVYDPTKRHGGLSVEEIRKAKIILWYGFCSVHQGFKPEHVDHWKQTDPQRQVIVHPECSFEVVQKSDDSGSTSYIIQKLLAAKEGERFAVGTEVNLVNRLQKQLPHLDIASLSPYQCLCTTMYRIRPEWLLKSLQNIQCGLPEHIIKVGPEVTKWSLMALERMMELSS